jgi:hypothetical protein
MANIGSEVERALNWKKKNNPEYSMHALERALELLVLTLESPKNKFRLKEIARTKEILLDYFLGSNEFGTTEEALRKYFFQFAYALRLSR